MGSFTNSGGTFATDSALGAVDWTTASNAGVSDNAYATSGLLLGQLSRYLKATNFNFNIPADATVRGITLSLEHSTNTLNATHDNSVRLVKGGTISGDDKASASLWPTTDATATYGSATDLWGLSWTPSDINSSDFGVVASAIADLAGTAQIDHVQLTVDYLGSNRIVQRRTKTGNGMSASERAT